MSTESKHTPTLPVLRARAWSCHAASTIVGDVDGKQVVFAEVAGNGRYGEEDAVIAAEFVRRCNCYAALQSQNAELVALLDQIHEAANKVYHMGDATCRNVLVNIYEISGKVAAIAKVQP